MRTIVHTSDLHFPRVDRQVITALSAWINACSPDLVVVSGDLTQRARRRQFLQAAAFLKSLRPPLLVVPGNHDVPMFNIAARVFSPLQQRGPPQRRSGRRGRRAPACGGSRRHQDRGHASSV